MSSTTCSQQLPGLQVRKLGYRISSNKALPDASHRYDKNLNPFVKPNPPSFLGSIHAEVHKNDILVPTAYPDLVIAVSADRRSD